MISSKDFYKNGDSWASAIEQIYSGPESELESIVRSLWAADCTITIQGTKMTIETLIDYMKSIRESHNTVEIQSKRWIRDGDRFAEKHTAIAHRKDGAITAGEVFIMGELNADGKAIWFEEILRLTEGDLDRELKS